jgi:hypothetical protein
MEAEPASETLFHQKIDDQQSPKQEDYSTAL